MCWREATGVSSIPEVQENMQEVLYFDRPFINVIGGDKNRSKFLWKTLDKNYKLRHALLDDGSCHSEEPGSVSPEIVLESSRERAGLLLPDCAFNLSRKHTKTLQDLLCANKYDFQFFRFLSTAQILRQLPGLASGRIIIDSDLLASRLSWQTWRRNMSIRNRYFLIQSAKLFLFEKELYQKPCLFLFTNKAEMDWVRERFQRRGAPSEFALVPNVMPDVPDREIANGGDGSDYILFHGVLNSSVNMDAFHFLVREIYPLLEPHLIRHGIWINVVGKGLGPKHHQLLQKHECPRIRLIGKVDDIGQAVTEALICLIPLRIGSGTKTRVLEAAAYGKCVVTTPIGAEGFEFDDTEITVADSPKKIAEAVSRLLDNQADRKALAANLRKRSIELYSENVVAKKLLDAFANYKPG